MFKRWRFQYVSMLDDPSMVQHGSTSVGGHFVVIFSRNASRLATGSGPTALLDERGACAPHYGRVGGQVSKSPTFCPKILLESWIQTFQEDQKILECCWNDCLTKNSIECDPTERKCKLLPSECRLSEPGTGRKQKRLKYSNILKGLKGFLDQLFEDDSHCSSKLPRIFPPGPHTIASIKRWSLEIHEVFSSRKCQDERTARKLKNPLIFLVEDGRSIGWPAS